MVAATRPAPDFSYDAPHFSGERGEAAEAELLEVLQRADLDDGLHAHPGATRTVDEAVSSAIAAAYGPRSEAAAHRFLHRTLYRINRLMLFWYDDVHLYENERSPWVLGLRSRIERAWQHQERMATGASSLPGGDVSRALRERAGRDVDARPSPAGRYFRDVAPLSAYRRLVAIASLDGLVEASQLSRTLGGVGNGIHATMTRLLLEEYGGGRLAKKHSEVFREMLLALDMRPEPEAYFDVVPWEVLASVNHSFLLSDRKRFFLRYVGGLLYTEVSVPAAFRPYRSAACRLGLDAAAMRYWELHIKEDSRHGPWMLDDVAIPLAERFPRDAWEIVLGYDQQRAMSARAGAATARAAACA